MERKSLINSHQNKLHHLAQFLAAFGNSYLPATEDHNQMNLGWDIAKSALTSGSFKGIHLELEYPGLMLFMVHNDKRIAYDPLGATLSDIDHWIRETLSEHGIDPTSYNTETDFDPATPEDVFISLDNEDEKVLLQLTEERNIAQKALESVREELGMDTSGIRIRPQHFNTEMLIYPVKDAKTTGIALGYTPADQISDTPYFYASAWSDKEINYNDLPEISPGRWHLQEWKGALIPVDQALDLGVITRFYTTCANAMFTRI